MTTLATGISTHVEGENRKTQGTPGLRGSGQQDERCCIQVRPTMVSFLSLAETTIHNTVAHSIQYRLHIIKRLSSDDKTIYTFSSTALTISE